MSHTGTAPTIVARSLAIEVSTDNTAWLAVSNAFVRIDNIQMTRLNGETYVGGSFDGAIVTWGKREPVELTITGVYNEETASFWLTVYNRFISATPTLGVRFAPQGLGTGNAVYATSLDGSTTGLAPIISVTLDTLEPGSGEAAMASVTVKTPMLRRYTAANNTSLG